MSGDLSLKRSSRISRRYRQKSQELFQKSPEIALNFLEAIFSFMFGDGHPNSNLEERRWQLVGAVIRQHQGVVVAEQIAPYLDDFRSASNSHQDYEDYMLPVLIHFNGRPTVTEDGHLVYQFPDLQTTVNQDKIKDIPPYLEEKKWVFSVASSGQILGAIGLGFINLIGVLILGDLLIEYATIFPPSSWIRFIQLIYPILWGYALAYLMIPLIRYSWIQWQNEKIGRRNLQRSQRTLKLTEPNSILEHKLNQARQFAGQNLISPDQIVYTTEEDLLEQETGKLETDKLDQ